MEAGKAAEGPVTFLSAPQVSGWLVGEGLPLAP